MGLESLRQVYSTIKYTVAARRPNTIVSPMGLNKYIHNDFSDGEALKVSCFSDWPGYKPHWSMKVYREGKEIEEQEQRISPSDIETEYCRISPQFCY